MHSQVSYLNKPKSVTSKNWSIWSIVLIHNQILKNYRHTLCDLLWCKKRIFTTSVVHNIIQCCHLFKKILWKNVKNKAEINKPLYQHMFASSLVWLSLLFVHQLMSLNLAPSYRCIHRKNELFVIKNWKTVNLQFSTIN